MDRHHTIDHVRRSQSRKLVWAAACNQVVVVQLWAAGRNQVVELLVAYQVVELLLVVANKVVQLLVLQTSYPRCS
jgi:hypothetical protein